MTRRADWKMVFDDLLKSKLDEPFAWGTNDCLQFVFAVEQAISRPSRFSDVSHYLVYDSPEGARQLMDEWGMADIDSIMDARLERVSANMLKTGDIGMIKYRTRNVLSVCLGRKFAHPWPNGLGYTDRKRIVCGWRV